MSDRHVLVIGAGGHAKVVISTLQAAGRVVECVTDDDEALCHKRVCGVRIIGKTASAESFPELDAIIAIGDNERRRQIAQRWNLSWTIAVHPSAVVHSSVSLGPGTVVFAGSVIQPGATIGSHTIINTSASVDHDCHIGNFVHIAPGTHLGGAVTVGDGAFLGIGSVVLPNLRIAEWAVLGAGAVSIHDLPARSVAVGVPARHVHHKVSNLNPSPGKRRRADTLQIESPSRDGVKATFIGPTDPRWLAALRHTRHDVYHLPEYLTFCAKFEGGEPLAFYAESEAGLCLIPVLVKRFPEHLDAPPSWNDLVSPYGYPCPLFSQPDDGQLVSASLKAFRTAADEGGACSVFLRLHPIIDARLSPALPLSASPTHGETVVVDLAQSEEEMWRQTRDGHREDIRRLEKLNFVPVMDNWQFYREFGRIYRETMERIGASPRYKFDDKYFADLRDVLGEHLHLCCIISEDGRVAGGGLFTTVNQIVEYHLSGSRAEFHRLAPTKLMLHFVRLWSKERGCSVLHLGGGVAAQTDTLFQFKTGFSPIRKEFRTYRLIANESRYAALNLRAGRALDLQADLEASFFPPYREAMSWG